MRVVQVLKAVGTEHHESVNIAVGIEQGWADGEVEQAHRGCD